MKVISFLGTSNYTETTYVYKGVECYTNLFPEALYAFFQPEHLAVFVTKEAEEKHWQALHRKFEERQVAQVLHPVHIPMGRSEVELWQIFDQLTAQIEDGEEVVFDITNAFRSIPVLVFIAIAYLRSARHVQLKAITYGAFEAKENNYSPVFDLSPFITLLDWTTATDKFLKTGNASELVKQLENAHQLPYTTDNQPKENLPRQLKNVANKMDVVSQALRLARAQEAMSATGEMIDRLEQARAEVMAWAKPFGVLLDQTKEAYQPFALNQPDQDVRQNLSIQLQLINWYLERGQTVQVIILAREWLVTLVAYRLGWHMIADRKSAEDALNSGAKALEDNQPLPTLASQISTNTTDLFKVWSSLGDLRNDVAHTGMRSAPRKTSKIIQSSEELYNRLSTLALELLDSEATL
jgi:hypothetical protein